MDKAGTARTNQRSDVASFRRMTRELMARVLVFVGSDEPGALTRTIDAVRGLTDPGYTVGDSQVDQQLVAGRDADSRITELLPKVDPWDRAVLLRHTTRLLAAAGEITEEGAGFLERVGALLEMDEEDVGYVVLTELSGNR